MTDDDRSLVVGVDFGSTSGRAVVVRVGDGAVLGEATHAYAHGVMTERLPDGTRLGADWALQVPGDYVDVLERAVPAALEAAGASPEAVCAIATDFTASTVLPVLADGTPLCELDEFADEPHAYVKLWKHHAAQSQADRINLLADCRGEAWLARYGGRISSEWEFAKALQVLEEAPSVYTAMDQWVEAADWIVWKLCGSYVRNPCTAGYKGIYQDDAYPSRDFLGALHPQFAGFAEEKLAPPNGRLGDRAGYLTPEAAALTGLSAGTVVAVGNVDAHVTAPAAQATKPGQMLAIMGTSTCHIIHGDRLREIPGMCGVVRDGITPGLWGYEAGQSGVGDILDWLVTHAVPSSYRDEADKRGISIHELLSDEAANQAVGRHGLVVLDWHSGNRSVLIDHELSGLIVGLSLATKPEDLYRAHVEATAFGTRTIIEAFEAAGISVDEFIVAGGLLRNRFLMQVYSDVLAMPISVVRSSQGPALGSAIHAAVAAGRYPDIHAASEAMGAVERAAYRPNPENVAAYDALYEEYVGLHDHFGRNDRTMRRLRSIRRRAMAECAS